MTPPYPISGGYDQTSFTPTYSGTLTGSFELQEFGSLPQARVAADTTGGFKVNPVDNTWSFEQTGSGDPWPWSGSITFGVTAGVTYWIYCYSNPDAAASVTFSWTGSQSDSINGSDSTSINIPRLAGTQNIGTYNIQWVGSKGGTKTFTGFTLSWTCSDPTISGRLTLTANPTWAQSGTISATIADTPPTATPIAPTNNAIVETGNPTFEFAYSDNEGDPQQSFEIQISTNSSFQTIVYDTGVISNSSTSFSMPSTNTLPYGFTYYWRVQATDNLDATGAWSQPISFTTVAPLLQVITTSLPNGTNGTFYTQTFQASGGQPPYIWSLALGSANPPASLILSTNGVLFGTLSATAGTYYFDVLVTDTASNTFEQDGVSLIVLSQALLITNISLPAGNVGVAYNAQLGGSGGQPPYTWSLTLGSANPPPGTTLNSNGLINGTPTTNGFFNFKLQVIDTASTVTKKVFGIAVNPKPILSQPTWNTNQFQMLLTGGTNQNYSIQMSTNLEIWTPLIVTNNQLTNSFHVTDPNATNRQRMYRVLIGP